MDLLIKNGTPVTESRTWKADILIRKGKISAVKNNISEIKGISTVDAASFYVFPGAVDAHVHFDLPAPAGNSADDFESGSKAAIAGGTTTVIDFVTPAKGESFIQALQKRKKIAVKSYIDYAFHMGITWWGPNSAKEVEQCVKKEGITSFKVYLAYKGAVGIDDADLIEAMYAVKKNNALLTIHCEHGDMIKKLQQEFLNAKKVSPLYHAFSRPAELEAEAISRVLCLAKIVGCRVYIVHVSSAKGMIVIDTARESGQEVFAETCPHYLLLNDSVYKKSVIEVLPYVMSPPLRTKKDNRKLWESLQNKTIDVVATDHCPFNIHGQKDRGINDFTKIPNGGNGVEERLSLLFTEGVLKKKISMNQFVELNCTNPAKIFGLYPQKGSLEIGADADLVIWNPKIKKIISAKTHHQKCDSNIYEGCRVTGVPQFVIKGGKIIFENGKYNLKNIQGKYLERK